MNREVGALLSLQPNAQKIVNGWNIDHLLSAARPTAERKFKILNVHGDIKMNIDMDDTKYGADRMVYHRQDLHTALREACMSTSLPGRPANIITSSKVIECKCEEALVVLEDGTRHQGDLVIGADGIHSVIRKAVTAGKIASASVEPKPTGKSAYRLLLQTKDILSLDVDAKIFDPRAQATTMMMGHDKRVIMGPARGGELLGIVALVPDERMHEDSADNTWTTAGSLDKLLDVYKDFPGWIRELFRFAPDIALWQLRDIDPLPNWTKGRTVIIGDAAHAMLPTQGQGASQSIEDAEALQAFFAGLLDTPSLQDIQERLERFFEARFDRASLIQAYSRQQAAPATEIGSTSIKLNPAEFMNYNCDYPGAVKWLERQRATKSLV